MTDRNPAYDPNRVQVLAPPPLSLHMFLRARMSEEGLRLDCGVNKHDGGWKRGLYSTTCPCEFPAKWAWRAHNVLLEELLATADLTDRADRDHKLLRVLATKYADHRDYRPEWKV